MNTRHSITSMRFYDYFYISTTLFLITPLATLSIFSSIANAQGPGIRPQRIAHPYWEIERYLYDKLSWGRYGGDKRWHYNIKHTGTAFYIGDNENHFTIEWNRGGYHHTISGKEFARSEAPSDIPALLIICNAEPKCTRLTLNALSYLDEQCPTIRSSDRKPLQPINKEPFRQWNPLFPNRFQR